jgi:hypothetical protein
MTARQLALLLPIRQVPEFILGLEPGYSDLRFIMVFLSIPMQILDYA